MHLSDKVYLASGSPRRRELLKNLFNNIRYLNSALGEPSWQLGQTPKTYLSHCLSVKWQGAMIALSQGFSDEIKDSKYCVLVADTTVVLKNKLLEKPKNTNDAIQMLTQLSANTHVVRTGLILGRFEAGELLDRKEFFAESKMSFYTLAPKEIINYVKSGEPMDKAGAYGFQDQALRFVKKMEGSYLNVVGLPLVELERVAAELGVN